MDNMDHKTKEFLDFLLNRVALTELQEKQVNNLIARDLSSKIEQLPTFEQGLPQTVNENEITFVKWHDPRSIVNFLNKFTGTRKGTLKYTTHSWDAMPGETRKDMFPTYADFVRRYNNAYKQFHMRYKRNDDCNHIWNLVAVFLGIQNSKDGWSKHHVMIRYDENVKRWMKQNPDSQPFAMPLSFIQEDIGQNNLIGGKRLGYFEDVVDLFKHCIEFRDDDLYYMVKRVFRMDDHIVDSNALNTLRGRSFYTDTEIIELALSIIASNISVRSAFPNVKIMCKEEVIGQNRVLQLEILQEKSYSNKNISNPKIRGIEGKGDMGKIRELLTGLCDFAVESTFRVNGELMPLRLTYLKNNELKGDKDLGVQKISYDECKGFKYILTFYLYDHDKDKDPYKY